MTHRPVTGRALGAAAVLQIAFTVTPNNCATPVEVVKLYRPTYQPY